MAPPEGTRSLGAVRHFFTVDLEEYFHAVALADAAPMSEWPRLPPRAAAATDRLLDLLARYDARATFFTVGWFAAREPALMRRIVAAGHELASHTWDHVRVTHQARDAFRASVRRTKAIMEQQTGAEVLGFRAPSFSIVRGCEWALDILLEEGYRYDSSLFPVRRRGYGYVGGARDPYWIERPEGRIAEIPPSTLRVAGLTLPAAGGAYFRLLPPHLVHAALRSAARRARPGTFYVHPWEWDPGQPRFDVPFLTRLRHYGGLGSVWGRMETLLARHAFTSIASALVTDVTSRSPVA